MVSSSVLELQNKTWIRSIVHIKSYLSSKLKNTLGRVTDRLVLAARDEVGAAGMEAHGVHIRLVAPESLNAT